jgi:hypothetical protein
MELIMGFFFNLGAHAKHATKVVTPYMPFAGMAVAVAAAIVPPIALTVIAAGVTALIGMCWFKSFANSASKEREQDEQKLKTLQDSEPAPEVNSKEEMVEVEPASPVYGIVTAPNINELFEMFSKVIEVAKSVQNIQNNSNGLCAINAIVGGTEQLHVAQQHLHPMPCAQEHVLTIGDMTIQAAVA